MNYKIEEIETVPRWRVLIGLSLRACDRYEVVVQVIAGRQSSWWNSEAVVVVKVPDEIPSPRY